MKEKLVEFGSCEAEETNPIERLIFRRLCNVAWKSLLLWSLPCCCMDVHVNRSAVWDATSLSRGGRRRDALPAELPSLNPLG